MNAARFLIICLSFLPMKSTFAQVLNYSWASNGNQPGDFCDPVKTAFDQQGNAYLLVNFTEQVSFGSLSLNPVADFNTAVIRFNTTGIAVWSAIAGSNAGVRASSMTIDQDGNVLIGGWYTNSLTLGALNLTFESNDPQNLKHEFFMAKLNSDGQWQWARKQLGEAYSEIVSLDTDQTGNVFAGGVFLGEQLTVGQESLEPEEDLPFVIKYSPTGQPMWLRGADTPFGATLTDLAVLPDGSVGFTGSFGTFETDAIDISFGQLTLTNEGDPDLGFTTSNIYVALLSSSGSYLWAKQAGSLNYESFSGSLAVDQSKIYLSGTFQNDITALGSAFSKTAAGPEGDTDALIASLDFNGNWQWLVGMGTAQEDAIPHLTASDNNLIYVYGNLNELALDLGTIELTASGQNNSFIARILEDGNWSWAFTHPPIQHLAARTSNSFLFTGKYTGSIQLDEFTLTATGSGDSPDVYLAAADYSASTPESLNQFLGKELHVYPQPIDKIFNLRVPEAGTWELYGLDGRKLGSGFSAGNNIETINLPVNDLKGLILLQFKGISGRTCQKKLMVI